MMAEQLYRVIKDTDHIRQDVIVLRGGHEFVGEQRMALVRVPNQGGNAYRVPENSIIPVPGLVYENGVVKLRVRTEVEARVELDNAVSENLKRVLSASQDSSDPRQILHMEPDMGEDAMTGIIRRNYAKAVLPAIAYSMMSASAEEIAQRAFAIADGMLREESRKRSSAEIAS